MRVLVIGTGVTGDAVVRFWRARDVEVRVIETDRATDTGAAASAARLVGVDLVVPSPGVPPDDPVVAEAVRRGVAVRSEVDLAAEVARAPLIAVTGTNGKTTVTTWITEMLTASGLRAVAAGNIGRPLLDAARGPADVLVAEVSSFQLHFTTEAFRPRVAVLLNVAADHLDWHGDVRRYRDDKARVFRFQGRHDLLVVNADDAGAAALATRAPGRVARFGASGVDVACAHADTAAPPSDLPPANLPSTVARRIGGLGSRIDTENATASACAALDVGATEAGVLDALSDPPRLHHRVEPVGQAGGVEFYDDSKATNPHATRAAVEGFAHVVLIAGGRNKSLDLGDLRPVATRLRAVVAIGDASREVAAAFADTGPRVIHADSMREAVRAAAAAARPGDAVLLSPACASFDWYRSYEARGDDFAREVAALLAEASPR